MAAFQIGENVTSWFEFYWTTPQQDFNATNQSTTVSTVSYLPWNNPQNIISKKTADSITDSLQCYVLPILTVIGILGNICSLIVLFQKKLRTSTTTMILIGLAFSDTCFLATNMVRKSSCIISHYDKLLSEIVSNTTFYYMHYLKTAFSRVSTFLVVLISLERVIAVGLPLKAKTLITKRRILAGVIACYVIAFGGLAAYPPQYTYTFVGKRPFIAYTDFAKNNVESLKIYNDYFLPIGFRHIPVVIVFLLNTVIIVLVHRSNRFQKTASVQDSKRKDDQKKITRMLLTVDIVYLICLLPGDIFLRCSIEIPEFQYFRSQHNLFLAISDITLLFEMINSCINFVIYMVLNRNFYDTYMRLFCCYLPYIRTIVRRRPQSDTEASMKTKETVSSRILRENSKDGASESSASEQHWGDKNGHDNLTYRTEGPIVEP
ncbi:probable G-protein coupled receptor B0563.6 [Dreissena polymorpha]|uniref:G-protein coupled receptors family 1 profile domain-containing protein n=1 Tax=Dreissena polymorpha TaxID=45954 RepID=A0A9D4MGB3_DREPO|nr:probable G-protein coupled receptor B0563.6 [Dreissena polymorpha]KAH3877072.1 hypothetical protein DPMN_000928 [Dreissena polymorpha]